MPFGVEKPEWCSYRMAWLPDGEKSLRIPACDIQTDDGRTDILRQHSARCALHRAVKTNVVKFSLV